jgi:hypothetical protein
MAEKEKLKEFHESVIEDYNRGLELEDLAIVKTTEKTDFSSSEFSYRLEAKEGIKGLEAQFSSNKITIYLPKSEALIWYDTDLITYKNNFEKLLLFIEKDFVCLDHTDEDQSDNYANPNTKC